MPYTLSWRQNRRFDLTVDIWRQSPVYDTTGALTGTSWLRIAQAARAGLNPNPSQFELQDFVLAEGDNIFTLDLWSLHVDEDVEPDDVFKCVSGHSKPSGGFWKIRGDFQALTFVADSARYVAARLQKAPDGVS